MLGLDRVLLIIGRLASRRGYDRLGLRVCVAAADANPHSMYTNIAAGTASRRAGDPGRALLYLQRAAAQDDLSKRGSWELAKFLLRTVRDTAEQETARELLTALRAASRSSEAVIRNAASLALSNALYEAGEYDEAEAAADVALSVAPTETRAKRVKANSLLPQNRFAEAAALYRELLTREPDNGEIARKVEFLDQLCDQANPPASYSSPTVLSDAKPRLLIGVGSGIGDILHATPMIRNIALRTGAKVEVIMAADHPHAEFLLDNRRYVSRVWPLSRDVLKRQYDTVFLTHFFGPLRFAFQAERIVTSSTWRRFRAGMLNDTLLNLEAAKHLLGIPYGEPDAGHYFAGALAWQPPGERMVGLHAGSKSGRWASKRWPYFAELAERLSAHGLWVASFGTPDEYVPGTENRTGGTIEEMSRAMVACSHFVSNDSGPMHIASALGIPVLALYGPTDALSHLPLRASTIALALEKSCSPCEVKAHPHFASGVCKCISEISLDAVEARVLEMLNSASRDLSHEPAPLVPQSVP
ncbi:MAG TPA: glycosyltransferase family 9 protein [Rhizomicrobium sp.]